MGGYASLNFILPARGIFNPINPASTTSTTAIMAGMGSACTLTSLRTGNVRATFTLDVINNTAADGTSMQIRYGTGTAPANGVAATGTSVGPIRTTINDSPTLGATTAQKSSSLDWIITGLTINTQYWFDLSYFTNAGTSTMGNMSVDLLELI